MTKSEHLSHEDMDNYYAEVIRAMAVDKFKPDVVVAPMRGGADFGIKVSNYYNIPFVPLQWQTRDGTSRDEVVLRQTLEKHKDACVLIVDDICDTGTTFIQIEAAIGFVRSNVRFAAAIENIECSFACDYAAREIQRTSDTQWFIFPWEDWWKRRNQ